MSLRRPLLALVAAFLACALIPAASWAQEEPAPGSTDTEESTQTDEVTDDTDQGGKGGGHQAGDRRGRGRPDHARRGADRFTLVGTVAAVDPAAGTVTVAVRAGRPRDLRGTEATVTLAEDAKVRRRGHSAVEDLQVGDRIAVRGYRDAEGTLVARRVNAAPPRPPAGSEDSGEQEAADDSTGDGEDDADEDQPEDGDSQEEDEQEEGDSQEEDEQEEGDGSSTS